MQKIKDKITSIPKYLWVNKKKKRVWMGTLLVLAILGFTLFGNSKQTDVLTYKVEAKEFVQNVSLTGKVIAAKNVDMGFETSGRIARVNFKVGDRVRKGQVIASLQNGDAISNLQKASARLSEVQGGSRSEEISIAEGDLINAKNNLDLSTQILKNELQNVYNKADEAIRSKIDNSFTNPRSVNPQFNYSIDQNSALKDRLSTNRLKVTEIFAKWVGKTEIENIEEVKLYIVEIQNFINDANTAISIATEKSVSTDANYTASQANKTDILAARTNFTAAVNSFNQAQITYKNSIAELNRAENNLKIKQSGGTQNEITIQRADVTNAQSFVSKTLIVAPFDGVITKVDVKEGEISSPSTPVISMLNDGEYQIETYVSENDISKLKVDQKTNISLDAYGRDVFFEGMIITIDPAETIKDGVSTYRTKIQFTQKDDRVKSGMTANIDIETDRRPDVMSIPQAAVVLEKGIKKVYLLKNDSCVVDNSCAKNFKDMKDIELVEIKTGEINNTGDIEIISGLENNQTIIYGKK
jgi:HlyD family secretion protein